MKIGAGRVATVDFGWNEKTWREFELGSKKGKAAKAHVSVAAKSSGGAGGKRTLVVDVRR